jgi:cytidyltransferase-like protein
MEEETQKSRSLKPIIVAVSGYFDPLHVGHLELFGRAKSLGDFLIVIVNNDDQLKLKRGGKNPFMKQEDRVNLIDAISFVDKVVLSIDKDDSVCETLKLLKPDIFAQGGDRYFGEVPETSICKEMGIKRVQGLGAKIRASSDIIGKMEEYDNLDVNMEEYYE